MKFNLTIILLIILFINAFSQEDNYPNFLIEGTGLYTDYSNHQYKQGGGISFDLFLGKSVSTHYVAYFGKDYFELSPGIIGLPLALVMLNDENGFNSFEELGLALFLFAISFENLSFTIKLNDDLYLSPSFSLFRLKYFYENNILNESGYLNVSGGIGIKLNQRIGRNLTIGAFAETGFLYNKETPWGYSTGINAGFYFPGRSNN